MIYYESDTEGTGIETSGCGKFSSAICYTAGSIIVWVLIIIIGAFVFNKAYIPYSDCVSALNPVSVTLQEDGSFLIGLGSTGICEDGTLDLPVSFIVTTIGMLTFVGWFCFAFFGGIGLPALPIDMIRSFIFRPKLITKSSFVERKKQLDGKLRDMMEVAEQLKDEEEGVNKIPGFMARRKAKSAHNTAVKQLKQSVYLIEQEYLDLESSYIAYKKYNPLVPFFKLIMGIFGIIITLLWILQIGLYVVPRQADVVPPTTFLNVMLLALDELSVIFGCVVFGVFVIYLMFCAIKGVFKFGLRFFCLSIHPMVLGRTSIVTFIFNLTIVLFCCAPVVMFSSEAFHDFVGYADIDVIFSAQIKRMRFLKYFYENNIFIYIFIAIAAISLFWLLIKPKDETLDMKEIKESIKTKEERQTKYNHKKREAREEKEKEIEMALHPPKPEDEEAVVGEAEADAAAAEAGAKETD